MSHTPGPWTIERPYQEPGLFVSAADPRRTNPLICRVKDTEEGEANARLIAEAPAMLAALQGATEVVAVLSEIVHGNKQVNAEMIDKWRSIIARAEGRTE